jgi:hypothetical protein
MTMGIPDLADVLFRTVLGNSESTSGTSELRQEESLSAVKCSIATLCLSGDGAC